MEFAVTLGSVEHANLLCLGFPALSKGSIGRSKSTKMQSVDDSATAELVETASTSTFDKSIPKHVPFMGDVWRAKASHPSMPTSSDEICRWLCCAFENSSEGDIAAKFCPWRQASQVDNSSPSEASGCNLLLRRPNLAQLSCLLGCSVLTELILMQDACVKHQLQYGSFMQDSHVRRS